MKKINLLLSLLVFVQIGFAQTTGEGSNPANKERLANTEIAIIPAPVSVVKQPGYFVLPANITIQIPKNINLGQTAELLQEKLTTATGFYASLVNAGHVDALIKLVINQQEDKVLGAEGYRLMVTPAEVSIVANQPRGLFYGVQSLLQMFPAAMESKTKVNNVEWKIPCATITDYPRFAWRGLMFDVARHFFTKEEVKKFIDDMVRYKYNLLHFHLTDDEGWRIEIKGLPKLTEIGAWNVKREGNFGEFVPPKADEPRTYGGFYTQEDIKELVVYAKERFVDIMPEIDVPGHSLAAIASYPELSCTPQAAAYKVRSGERIMDWSRGAPPIALVDNTLCPANEKVYEFLDSVFTQVAALFPFEYIHVGGDEAPHNFWEKNPAVLDLMKRENLKSMPQVQGYFQRRLEKIIYAKGKKPMAWDEVLDGNISKKTGIMVWRKTATGATAAKLGHEVVMTPSEFVYLDYMQGDMAIEPKVYASLRLNKTYQFNPLPEGVNPKLIKGGQGNIWTEQIYNMRHLQYMLWPRGFAVAESLWSPPQQKNWTDFISRTENQFKRLDIAEIKYATSIYEPIITVKRSADKSLMITLATEIAGLDIHYSFDNSFPDNFYPKYTSSLAAPIDAKQLRMVTYRNGKPVSRMMTIPINDLQKRAK